jgi:hypothetical protein
MTDDPYLSLAAFLYVAGVYDDAGEFNPKFVWADYLRSGSHIRSKPARCRDITRWTKLARNHPRPRKAMPDRYPLQVRDDDVSLLNLVTDDTVLLSSATGYNNVRYAVLFEIHRDDADQWCEILDRAGRPYRFERITETGDSEEVRVAGSPD